jgi:hypothetical protein
MSLSSTAGPRSKPEGLEAFLVPGSSKMPTDEDRTAIIGASRPADSENAARVSESPAGPFEEICNAELSSPSAIDNPWERYPSNKYDSISPKVSCSCCCRFTAWTILARGFSSAYGRKGLSLPAARAPVFQKRYLKPTDRFSSGSAARSSRWVGSREVLGDCGEAKVATVWSTLDHA